MSDARRIEFVYFDLGNVLIAFDHERASRQMSELVGASATEVHRAVFDSGLELRYERGELTSEQFYRVFCGQFGDVPRDALMRAVADIFEPIGNVHNIVEEVHAGGHRLGILSNTCEAHWLHCRERYEILKRFELYALSYELRSIKPEPQIYTRAAELCGVEGPNIFFVDDRQENVAAALDAGFDAVRFTTPESLSADLTARRLL